MTCTTTLVVSQNSTYVSPFVCLTEWDLSIVTLSGIDPSSLVPRLKNFFSFYLFDGSNLSVEKRMRPSCCFWVTREYIPENWRKSWFVDLVNLLHYLVRERRWFVFLIKYFLLMYSLQLGEELLKPRDDSKLKKRGVLPRLLCKPLP